jgi:hypothetical protein
MTLQEIISILFPYLSSIRKMKNYLSIDLIFPKGWEFPNQYIEKSQVVQNEKYTGEGIFLSFVCEVEKNMDNTLEVIFEIINHNIEREEKERLLKAKVLELKEVFKNTSLKDLHNLRIEFPEPDAIEEYLNDDEEDEV